MIEMEAGFMVPSGSVMIPLSGVYLYLEWQDSYRGVSARVVRCLPPRFSVVLTAPLFLALTEGDTFHHSSEGDPHGLARTTG
jgi:hypothetical protein